MLDKVNKIIKNVVALIYAMGVIIAFISVFFRYVLNMSLYWGEELVRYSFIWVVFLGAIPALIDNEHIVMDFFHQRFSDRAKEKMNLFINIILIIFFGYLVHLGIKMVNTNIANLSPALQISKGLVSSVIPISFGLMAIFLLRRFIFKVTGYKKKKREYRG